MVGLRMLVMKDRCAYGCDWLGLDVLGGRRIDGVHARMGWEDGTG